MSPKKFFIFTQPRSGSELLVSLLNTHPDIHCGSEIFSDFCRLPTQKVLFPHWYMKGKSSGMKAKVYGFKLISAQLQKILIVRWHGRPDQYLNYLHQSGWKILHLQRNNIFRKALSFLSASSTNLWHARGEDGAKEKVRIDPVQLLSWISRFEKDMTYEEQSLRNIPHLTIGYEEGLLKMCCHQKTLDAIFAYIGVPSAPVKSQYKRLSSARWSKTIENYEEIYEAIRQSPYAQWLDSDVGIPVFDSPVHE